MVSFSSCLVMSLSRLWAVYKENFNLTGRLAMAVPIKSLFAQMRRSSSRRRPPSPPADSSKSQWYTSLPGSTVIPEADSSKPDQAVESRTVRKRSGTLVVPRRAREASRYARTPSGASDDSDSSLRSGGEQHGSPLSVSPEFSASAEGSEQGAGVSASPRGNQASKEGKRSSKHGSGRSLFARVRASLKKDVGAKSDLELERMVQRLSEDHQLPDRDDSSEEHLLDDVALSPASSVESLKPDVPLMKLSETELAGMLSVDNPGSALCRLIKARWHISPSQLEPWELDRIYYYCLESTLAQGEVPEDADSQLACLEQIFPRYRTTFQAMLPALCRHLDDQIEAPMWSEEVLSKIKDDDNFKQFLEKRQDPAWVLGLQNSLIKAERFLHTSMYDTPSCQAMDYLNYAAQVGECARELEKCRTVLEADGGSQTSTLLQALSCDLNTLEQRLYGVKRAAELADDNDFRNPRNWTRTVQVMAQAAETLLNGRYSGFKNAESLATALASVRQWQKQNSRPGKNKSSYRFMIREINRLDNAMAALLSQHKISREDYDDVILNILKNTPATIHEHRLACYFEHRLHELVVRHTPAGCLRFGYSDDAPGRDPYEISYNGKTVPSFCRGEKYHPVNVIVTELYDHGELTSPDQSKRGKSEPGQPVYRVVRTGVPQAYAVDYSLEKMRATTTRWKEIFTTILLTFFEGRIIAAATENGDRQQVIELPLFYNCLLSPDRIRDKISGPKWIDDEYNWCKAMFERAQIFNSGAPVPLHIHCADGKNSHLVLVKPNIHMFINPCNELAYAPRWSRSGTWKYADEVNRVQFTRLFGSLDPESEIGGELGEFLQAPHVHPVIKQVARELADVIRYMFQDNLHHVLWQNPFMFSMFQMALGRLMGFGLVEGCKSAKDRTGNSGRCDMPFTFWLTKMCEKLIAEYDAGKPIPQRILPPADRRMTMAERFNGLQFLFCSGQERIQMDNVFKPGFKIPPYMLGYLKEYFPLVDYYIKGVEEMEKGSL